MFAKQGSGGNSDSSDSDEEDLWKSRLNQAEQMHMLASANVNPNERNIEFDKDDLKRYKKQAKKILQEMKWKATRKDPSKTYPGASRYSRWYIISKPSKAITWSKTLLRSIGFYSQ